ncbi:uncharacterized protein LOC111367092 [Olea europaea var. sylvestris]|uniref:uncharacterized protein LOC111367092 n=1 Tax=Olea europaea var. sylvestris TaxID=158386 RepID=UPI000C1CE690|nr:uncharacterized protein LOC111367092 [Olea europaea var. sylvestris]
MNGRGGCCIARYTGSDAYDMSNVGRIMMRFRPIAPKPAFTNGSVSGAGANSSTTENTDPSVKTGRGKRKHAKDTASGANNTNKRVCNRKIKASPENTAPGGSVSGVESLVTLPLFPQASDGKENKKRGAPSFPLWLSFGSGEREDSAVVLPPEPPRAMVGSWVKVESVINTLLDCYRLGRTDEERMVSLQRDTCPGIISDGLNRVLWTNEAYRKMVGGAAEEVVAWLVMKAEAVVPAGIPSFTCRVRVVTFGKDKISLTLPCDVWRMDCGGFAWRLDTTAALSLGR